MGEGGVAATETGLGRPRLQVYQIHKTIYNGSVDKKRHIEREGRVRVREGGR